MTNPLTFESNAHDIRTNLFRRGHAVRVSRGRQCGPVSEVELVCDIHQLSAREQCATLCQPNTQDFLIDLAAPVQLIGYDDAAQAMLPGPDTNRFVAIRRHPISAS